MRDRNERTQMYMKDNNDALIFLSYAWGGGAEKKE